MNTNRLYGMMLAVVALTMTGCQADVFNEHQGEVPIALTATVQEGDVTRAGTAVQSTQFANQEKFYAYFPTGVKVGSTTSASSTTYTANGSGGATPATQPYFNADVSSATVHAYYPYVSGKQVTNSTSSFSVEQDQTSDANYNKSDLMYATTTVQKASPTASLTFTHKMSKILVTANIGAGITNIQGIRIIGGSRTINIATPLSCTLGTTLSNANSTSSYITMYSGTSTSAVNCAALIPPQTINGNFLQIVTDKGTATYSLSSKQFETGKSYQLTITVNQAAVGTTTSITGWTGTGNVTVNPTVVKGGVGAIAGVFSVSSSTKVLFSQGNLQATYNGSSWTWAFAANQWDYIGNAPGNTSVTSSSPFVSGANVTVDLFGWVGASSTWTGVNKYGITSSTATNATNGYGNQYSENLKSDWGTLIGTGWRTLTLDEWKYLFNSRSTGGSAFGTSNARYAFATINTNSTAVVGVILFPNSVTIAASEVTTAGTVNGNSNWATKCTTAQWTALAAKGCVFLPAPGYRQGSIISDVDVSGSYWSSTSVGSNSSGSYVSSYCPGFTATFGTPQVLVENTSYRSIGHPVRLVRNVN